MSEVLITLLIIGIIAIITVPVIFAYYQEKSFNSALKKNYSVLSNALSLMQKRDYDDYLNWEFKHGKDFTKSIIEKLTNYLNIVKICDDNDKDCSYPVYTDDGKLHQGFTKDGAVELISSNGFILNDGTVILLDVMQNASANAFCGIYSNLLGGGHNLVFVADVNGVKKPNVVGKDVYAFVLTSDGLKPAGADDDSNCKNKAVNYHWSCTAQKLAE